MSFPYNVVGHGVDVIEISDFVRLVNLTEQLHLERYFTARELAAVAQDVRRIERLAGRLAIKEAVLKALGVGWGDGIAFTDVETSSLESGAPVVELHRQLAIMQQEQKIEHWLISTSHTNSIVFASAIAAASSTIA